MEAVVYAIQTLQMKTTVYTCMTVHNRSEYTRRCIRSILKQTYKPIRIVVCDDGSTDDTKEVLFQFKDEISILEGDGNLWWTGGMNMCVKYALEQSKKEDSFVFTINNDTELDPNAVETLLSTYISAHNKKTIVGLVNVFYNNPQKIEPSAFVFKKGKLKILKKVIVRVNNWGENLSLNTGTIAVDTLSGKGVLLPKRVFHEIGIYNSKALPHYHADTEFIFRAKNSGYDVLLSYEARVLSHQELSGIGTRTSRPKILDLLNSFFSIKSPHNLKALYNRSRLIYGKGFIPYFFRSVIIIILGFTKRFFSNNTF